MAFYNHRDVGRAFDFAQRCLSQVGWQCVRAFGDDSIGVRVARFSFDRVARQQTAESGGRSLGETGLARLWRRRWSLRRGFCDCACDPSCCDPSCCDGGAVDGCECASNSCSCVDPCLCCWEPSDGKGKKERGTAEAQASSLVGMTGHAVGPLNPSGFVLVGEKRLPAQSQGEWIDDEAEVVVIADGSFGVTVTPKD